MATIVVKSIGTAGRDYSTLQAWEDACPADLVAVDQIWKGECYNDSEFTASGGTLLVIAGQTTDATRYVWLSVAAGHSFADHASKLTNPLRYDQTKGVGLRVTGSYAQIIAGDSTGGGVAAKAYTRIDRIQCYYDSTFSSGFYNGIAVSTGGVVDGILFRSRRTGDSDGIKLEAATVKNSVLIQTVDGVGQLLRMAGAAKALNNTFLKADDLPANGKAIAQSYGTNLAIKNNAVFGNFAQFFPTANIDAANSGYNATNAATAPGSNNQLNLVTSAQFAATATSASIDARVKAGNGLVAGIRDAANTNDLDILGQARSTTTPTIGAMEYVASGTPLASNAASTATASASLTTVIALAAAAAAIATASANLSVGNTISATASAVATATAALTTSIRLAASASATATASANLTSATAGTFTTEPLINNTGTILTNQAVSWTWTPAGRIGSMSGKTPVDGTGTTNASTGRLTVTGLTAGAGMMMVSVLGATTADDAVYLEFGTVP